jgi:putative ABC transport system ATP-binding protein
MDVPTSGAVRVAGCSLGSLTETARTDFRRSRVGFVFQNFNLVPVLTVEQNLALPLALNGIRAPTRIADLLVALGLEHRRAAYPETLSGGEQQRVAIGRALIHYPALILADEPTGNLDQQTGADVLVLMREQVRAHRATLVMATHSTEAAQIADAVCLLRGGHLVQSS